MFRLFSSTENACSFMLKLTVVAAELILGGRWIYFELWMLEFIFQSLLLSESPFIFKCFWDGRKQILLCDWLDMVLPSMMTSRFLASLLLSRDWELRWAAILSLNLQVFLFYPCSVVKMFSDINRLISLIHS